MRKLLRIAAIAYVAYLAIALLLITPALNVLPHWYMKDRYARELRTGWVLFNPFKVSLDVRDAALHDDSGEPFIAFSDASLDLSMESLWQPGWVLDRVVLRDLRLDAARLAPGDYTFSDLLAPGAGAAPPAEAEPAAAANDGQLPGVTVRDVDLHAAAITLTDRARETPFTSRWNNLRIRLTEVSTVIDEARPYSVEIEAADGGKLQAQGNLSLAQGTSDGRVALGDLDLVNAWRYARPWLAFELKSGRLSAEGEYQANWKDAPGYRISAGRIGLSDIAIAPAEPAQLPDTALAVKALDIGGIALDSATRAVSIDAVTLDAPAVATVLKENRVSLQALFAVTLPASPAGAPDEAPPWTLALNRARLQGGSLQWRSQFTDPGHLAIAPIEASLEHLAWPLSGDTRLSANLTANGTSHIAAAGTLALATGTGDLEYSLDGLPLAWFNPNLPGPLKLTITGGHVALEGVAALRDFAPATIAADVKIREFSSRMVDEKIMLTGFDLLHLDGVDVDMAQHTLALSGIALDGYTGRLHIHKDGSINAANVWKQEMGDEAQQIAEELTEDRPWRFSIPLVRVSDSAIDFMDESLPIQFRTVIGDLEGEVRDLASDPGVAARVAIAGSVDGYAPVTLEGRVAPMASPADLDLRLVFDGVDMALLSPYSGTYAGYRIERGLLDLDLHYSLRDNRLQGDNVVRIEKLKLGEKIASDKAVDLPLELALALLTDSNGVIDLAVPVTGDVDNPQFDLGGVISSAFINLITKAITAPFTLLAGLANSEEDLQRIAFRSGSAALTDSSREKLTELAAALAQRPRLSLVITGRLNLAADRERLQRDALTALLLEGGLSAEEIKARGEDWAEAIAGLYAALPAGGATPAEPDAREQAAAVARSIAVPDQQLIELAGQRAVAVKQFLVAEAGLAAERAVVGQPSLKEGENAFSGVELGIGG